MDNYLVNREVLEQFIDDLMRKKPLPIDSVEEIRDFREKSINALDKKIGMAIFEKLSNTQLTTFNQLLDSGEENPETFKKFFEDSGVDLQKTIEDALNSFRAQFLGDENAR